MQPAAPPCSPCTLRLEISNSRGDIGPPVTPASQAPTPSCPDDRQEPPGPGQQHRQPRQSQGCHQHQQPQQQPQPQPQPQHSDQAGSPEQPTLTVTLVHPLKAHPGLSPVRSVLPLTPTSACLPDPPPGEGTPLLEWPTAGRRRSTDPTPLGTASLTAGLMADDTPPAAGGNSPQAGCLADLPDKDDEPTQWELLDHEDCAPATGAASTPTAPAPASGPAMTPMATVGLMSPPPSAARMGFASPRDLFSPQAHFGAWASPQLVDLRPRMLHSPRIADIQSPVVPPVPQHPTEGMLSIARALGHTYVSDCFGFLVDRDHLQCTCDQLDDGPSVAADGEHRPHRPADCRRHSGASSSPTLPLEAELSPGAGRPMVHPSCQCPEIDICPVHFAPDDALLLMLPLLHAPCERHWCEAGPRCECPSSQEDCALRLAGPTGAPAANCLQCAREAPAAGIHLDRHRAALAPGAAGLLRGLASQPRLGCRDDAGSHSFEHWCRTPGRPGAGAGGLSGRPGDDGGGPGGGPGGSGALGAPDVGVAFPEHMPAPSLMPDFPLTQVFPQGCGFTPLGLRWVRALKPGQYERQFADFTFRPGQHQLPRIHGKVVPGASPSSFLKTASVGAGAGTSASQDELLELVRVILQDIPRTFSTHLLFLDPSGTLATRAGSAAPATGDGWAPGSFPSLWQPLFNLLVSYIHLDLDTGYCQGMSYLAAVLLLHMPEQYAFWCFVALVTSDKHLVGFFDKNLTQLQLKALVFEHVLTAVETELALHLSSHHINPLMYIAGWFMRAFTNLPDWQTCLWCFDRIVLDGWAGLVVIAVAVMQRCKFDLLNLHSINQLLPYLHTLQTEEVHWLNLRRAMSHHRIDLSLVYETNASLMSSPMPAFTESMLLATDCMPSPGPLGSALSPRSTFRQSVSVFDAGPRLPAPAPMAIERTFFGSLTSLFSDTRPAPPASDQPPAAAAPPETPRQSAPRPVPRTLRVDTAADDLPQHAAHAHPQTGLFDRLLSSATPLFKRLATPFGSRVETPLETPADELAASPASGLPSDDLPLAPDSPPVSRVLFAAEGEGIANGTGLGPRRLAAVARQPSSLRDVTTLDLTTEEDGLSGSEPEQADDEDDPGESDSRPGPESPSLLPPSSHAPLSVGSFSVSLGDQQPASPGRRPEEREEAPLLLLQLPDQAGDTAGQLTSVPISQRPRQPAAPLQANYLLRR
ncbi:hypothetical protein H696_01664 [Fonticula alba]|uniref:Rab-GAP TBC domain-containing protein n=1 Tax=Fonticula alba TaxID=691883 RepID=A0A058ZFL6_FONAL|nr:hypothetical protein H696_01664 [Fonticula alba]KCV72267.1 hypothetical protein H696_01664 [Fonticula alba]|eukprot:XP_009493845.1 hypothetical protein H696_01664 [Fonticula alba]